MADEFGWPKWVVMDDHAFSLKRRYKVYRDTGLNGSLHDRIKKNPGWYVGTFASEKEAREHCRKLNEVREVLEA